MHVGNTNILITITNITMTKTVIKKKNLQGGQKKGVMKKRQIIEILFESIFYDQNYLKSVSII